MERSPRVNWAINTISGKKILDIGFVGESDDPLVHHEIRKALPDALVVGIDINFPAIRACALPDIVAGDAFRLPFGDGTFDAVALLEMIEHTYDAHSAIGETRRVLSPGGHLYLTTPSPYSWTRLIPFWLLSSNPCRRENYRGYLGAADHKIFWEPLSLMNLLDDQGFQVLSATTKNHRIPLLGRFIKKLRLVNLNFYPMNRLGGYSCIVARAV